jgi:hypothetical protein
MNPATPATPDSVVVVSGLPRSGTSLMMAMLQAGGLLVLTDGQRAADKDNPNGYFELEAVKRLRTGHAWLAEARGKAVKIVIPLVCQLPAGFSYRVVLMERDLDELVASQAAMLARKGVPLGLPAPKLKAIFLAQFEQARTTLTAKPDCHVLPVSYAEILRDPGAAAIQVSAFLERPLDALAMAAVLDRSLYRQRKGFYMSAYKQNDIARPQWASLLVGANS